MESEHNNLIDFQKENFVKFQGIAFVTLMCIFIFLKDEGKEDQYSEKNSSNITTSFFEWCEKTGNIVSPLEISNYVNFSASELQLRGTSTAFKMYAAVLAASSDDMKKYYKEKLYKLAQADGEIPYTKRILLDALETMWV